jgi:hypothetical protein
MESTPQDGAETIANHLQAGRQRLSGIYLKTFGQTSHKAAAPQTKGVCPGDKCAHQIFLWLSYAERG